MPMERSAANSRVRRMIPFASVLNTLATAMSVVMTEKHSTNSWKACAIRRFWRAIFSMSLTLTTTSRPNHSPVELPKTSPSFSAPVARIRLRL